MTCQMIPMTVKQRAFLESIRWADAVYPHGILVVDIDFDQFNMSVVGDSDHVNEFSNIVRRLFFSACTTIEEQITLRED